MTGASIHWMSMSILMDELQHRGISIAASELDGGQKALKKDYIAKHGGY